MVKSYHKNDILSKIRTKEERPDTCRGVLGPSSIPDDSYSPGAVSFQLKSQDRVPEQSWGRPQESVTT